MTNPFGSGSIKTPAPQSCFGSSQDGRIRDSVVFITLVIVGKVPNKDRGYGIGSLTWPFNGFKWRINGGDPITTETWTRLSWDSIRQPDNPNGRGAHCKYSKDRLRHWETSHTWQATEGAMTNGTNQSPINAVEIRKSFQSIRIPLFIRLIYPLTRYHILMNKGLPSLPSLKLTVSLSLKIDS